MSENIQVLKTVERAYMGVPKDMRVIFQAAWLPWLLSFLLGFVLGFVDGFLGTQMLSRTLVPLVGAIFGAYFAIAMHRYYLSGRTPGTGRVKFKFHKTEQIFLVFVAIYWSIFVLLPFLVQQTQNSVLLYTMLVIVILSIPAFICTSLVLPAAAADHDAPFSFGWDLGRGNRLRLFAVMALTALPVIIVPRLLTPVMQAYPFATTIAWSIAAFPLSAIAIAGICAAYDVRARKLPEADGIAAA